MVCDGAWSGGLHGSLGACAGAGSYQAMTRGRIKPCRALVSRRKR